MDITLLAISSMDVCVVLSVGMRSIWNMRSAASDLAFAGFQLGVAGIGAALLADLLQAFRIDGQTEQLAPVRAQASRQAVVSRSWSVSG